jgi:hypothetical protein
MPRDQQQVEPQLPLRRCATLEPTRVTHHPSHATPGTRIVLGVARPKLTDHLEQPPLNTLTPAAKLVWLYVADHGEGEYTVRGIAKALHLNSPITVQTALETLKKPA